MYVVIENMVLNIEKSCSTYFLLLAMDMNEQLSYKYTKCTTAVCLYMYYIDVLCKVNEKVKMVNDESAKNKKVLESSKCLIQIGRLVG